MIYIHCSFYVRDRVVANIITTYVPNVITIYAKKGLKHVTYV